MKSKFILIFLLILVLTVGTAFGGAMVYEAVVSDISITLNGDSIDEEVLIVNGSSYIPLAALAELIGVKVEWNGDDRQIELTSDSSISADTAALIIEKDAEILELNQTIAQLKGNVGKADWEVADYSITYDSKLVELYEDDWDGYNDFIVNGQSYKEGVYGIKLLPTDYVSKTQGFKMKISNPDHKKYLDIIYAKDEQSSDEGFSMYITGYIKNSNTYVNLKTNSDREENNGIYSRELDISSYDEIYVTVLTGNNSTTYSNQMEKLIFNSKSSNTTKYILMFEPRIK